MLTGSLWHGRVLPPGHTPSHASKEDIPIKSWPERVCPALPWQQFRLLEIQVKRAQCHSAAGGPQVWDSGETVSGFSLDFPNSQVKKGLRFQVGWGLQRGISAVGGRQVLCSL